MRPAAERPSRPDEVPAATRVVDRTGAERLVAQVLTAMGELEVLMEAETAHVRAGRIREGLSQGALKGELAGRYICGLQTVKANAVALARLAPDAVGRLETAHARFGAMIATNQTVLATARAVSENLVRELSDELGRGTRAPGYAPAGPAQGRGLMAQAQPLVLSRSL